MTTTVNSNKTSVVITPEEMLSHWQGHRSLTRRVIEAFPEDKLFNFSVGGMRPFSTMVVEMLDMAIPGLNGIITRTWQKAEDMEHYSPAKGAANKRELLRRWDETTEAINNLWPTIPEGRFQEADLAFGQWQGQIYWFLLYFIDNEIHHRAQGYVYLRALGIEPPPFWERA